MDTCVDDDEFRDVRGFGCATWNLRSHNCAHIERDFGYTTTQANRVRAACKVACETCTSDRALIHHVGVPRSYRKKSGPYPLFLYFHGWGGNGEECGNVCDHARSNGFVTVAMRGMGPDFYASWRSPRFSWSKHPHHRLITIFYILTFYRQDCFRCPSCLCLLVVFNLQ